MNEGEGGDLEKGWESALMYYVNLKLFTINNLFFIENKIYKILNLLYYQYKLEKNVKKFNQICWKQIFHKCLKH